MAKSRPSKHNEGATKMSDGEFSAPIYACKYCDKQYLSWGGHDSHRRLFEAPDKLHECRRAAEKEQRCACCGFGDFTIPIEHYTDHRFERKT